MSVIRDRRISRVNFIQKKLGDIMEKEKTESFDMEKFVAHIMVSFGVSKRVALEDISAVKIVLGWK